MKADIILSGVGGQGILSIAAVIGEAALKEGLYMKQAEVHGMSQRGGDVQSNLRLSDQPIASDLIPLGQADLIISLEPMANIVMLGAAAPFIGIEYDKIADGIRRIFGRKGEEIVEMNLKALKAGYDVAQSMQK